MGVSQQRALAVVTFCLMAACAALLYRGWSGVERPRDSALSVRTPPGPEEQSPLAAELAAVRPRELIQDGRRSQPVLQAAQRSQPVLRAARRSQPVPPAPVSVPRTIAVPPSPTGVSFSGRAVLLDGTPVTFGRVVALHPLEGNATRGAFFAFAPRYKELASAPIDSLGHFRLGPMDPGSYDLAIMANPMYICATQMIGEQSGEGPVDVRFNATLVELVLPDVADARTHPGWGIWCRSQGSTNEVGLAAIGGDTRSGGTAGHTHVTFDEDGSASFLLPSGPGYFIVATPDQPPGAARQLAASLEASLPSGVVRLPLTAEVASLGTVIVSVTGTRLSAGEFLMVSLRPRADEFDMHPTAPVFLGEEDVALKRHGRLLVPPGTYAVQTLLSGTETLDASASRAEITVSAGRVQGVGVHLSRMGTLAVEIEAEGEGHHLSFVFERWDEIRDVWVLLPVHTMSSRGNPQSAPHVPLGRRGRVISPLPGGSLRVRLRREGWRTHEATVAIRPGELVVWRPIVERLD